MVTHFDATLGMGGWLDLTQPGLSPCKKYKTSWRSSDKSLRIIKLLQPFPKEILPILLSGSPGRSIGRTFKKAFILKI